MLDNRDGCPRRGLRAWAWSLVVLLSAGLAGTVLRSEPPSVTYPQLALGGGYECTLMVSNQSDASWTGTATLRMGADQAWPAPWSMNGTAMGGTSAFQISLAPRSCRKFVLSGDAQARAGYLRVAGQSGSTDTIATSFFYNYSQGPGLIDSTGVPQGRESRSFWFPVEKTASVNTGFAFVSSQAGPGFGIHASLFDGEGTLVQFSDLVYSGHAARFFTGPGGLFQVPDGFVGAMRIESQQPILLTVLRLANTSAGFQLTSLPPTPEPDPDSPAREGGVVYPQLALGGGYEPVLYLGNRGDTEWSGVLELRKGDDQVWATPWSVDGVRMNPPPGFPDTSSFEVTLSPGVTRRFRLGGDASARDGYLRIRPLAGSMEPVGTGFFYNFSQGAQLADSTGVPESPAGAGFWLPVEKSPTVNTGLALVSAGEEGPFDIAVTLRDAQGNEAGRRTLVYDGHLARFFAGPDGIFDGVTDGFLGAMEILSEKPLHLTVLRLTATADGFQLTSAPPAFAGPRSPAVQPRPGAWSGDGLSLRVNEDGSISDLEFLYEGTSSCDNCRIAIATLPWNSGAFHLVASGVSLDGSFVDATHLQAWIGVGSTRCPVATRQVSAVRNPTLQLLGSFDAPGSSSWGLTFDGTNLWASSGLDPIVYRVSLSGQVLGSFSVPGMWPRGLAFEGNHLWLGDEWEEKIYKLSSTGSLLETFDAPGNWPQGLAFDGTDLWVAESTQHRIYRMNLNGVVQESFSSPGTHPTGLAFDGTDLWVADLNDRKIYRIDLTGQVLDTYDAPGYWPAGLTFVGNELWHADMSSGLIYRFAID